MPQAGSDTAMRLIELYTHRDPALASALSQGLQLDKIAAHDGMRPEPGVPAMRIAARGAAKLSDPQRQEVEKLLRDVTASYSDGKYDQANKGLNRIAAILDASSAPG